MSATLSSTWKYLCGKSWLAQGGETAQREKLQECHIQQRYWDAGKGFRSPLFMLKLKSWMFTTSYAGGDMKNPTCEGLEAENQVSSSRSLPESINIYKILNKYPIH